ncbi:MAG TPA: TonB-dependent receptor, partial [Steroidobacteraceae bacterium]|nr:TonB-dependent receptor [Steroidobacteraceae bacterium]
MGQRTISRTATGSSLRQAITAVLGIGAATGAHADYSDSDVTVVGTRDEIEASSPKYTASLRDTPQTITVLSREVIADQGLLTLREVLSTVPGITFGAGEGGGGYGDSINLRGFSGSNDITIDGMRDSAQYTRSDPFNLEQVEVVNGANSVYSGAGAVGGSVNLVSKTPQRDSFDRFSTSTGTAQYRRVAADLNHELGADKAVRVNAVWHRNDVSGRDVERYERWGIAPSLALNFSDSTALTVSYFHQEDDNIPQYGVPTYRGHLLPGADLNDYYGFRNVDTQQIDTDVINAMLTHSIRNGITLRNQTRALQVDQLSVVDPPQGTFCVAETGLTPAGAACVAGNVTVEPGYYLPSGPRGNSRDTRNRAIANQTDLSLSFATGSFEHSATLGLAITHETFNLTSGNVLRNPDGTTPVFAPTPIDEPNSLYEGPRNLIVTNLNRGELDNQALYVFDAVQIASRWQVNAGVRYEHNDGDSAVTSIATPAAGGQLTTAPAARNAEWLLSYRAGVVFNPTEHGSVYIAYGNSQTPSKASVNGTCTLPISSTGATQVNSNCSLDPETAVNYEFGTKWEWSRRSSVSAALFRNERTNYRVNDPGNPDNPAQEQRLDGRARVDGFALGVAFNMWGAWSTYANYTHLESEVIQGASDY